ncbi:integrase, catalytic region, zinc finger, CCHC-type containing protein [Tanacetum coccineum]
MYPPPHLSQLQISHSSIPPSQQYQSHMDHKTSSVPPIACNSTQSSTKPMTEFPQMDSSLSVPVFNQGDDPITCLNKAMTFLTAVASSRFPSTNNQLRTPSNPRNQATIQDGKVIVQQVQGRQGQSYADTGYKGNTTSSGGNNAGGQTRVIKCYNFQGEGHMARLCTQPKRPRNAAWFKEKAMLAEAHEFGSRYTNLYTISLDDMLNTSPIYLLSKASKTKSWLWHRQLSHLNFGTLNKLAKDGLARGIPKLKFKKDCLCSACALGKSKKSFHQSKAKDTNQEKLYLLHMDLYGPMRVESVNGKKYILVIVDDYS